MASCWAMGRSSAEATKASLMRAVCARRAARSFALTGFLEGLAAWRAGFAAVFLGEPPELARALVAWLAGFAVDFFTAPEGFAVFFAAVADLLADCVGFRAGLSAAEEAGFFVAEASAVAEPLEDCPASGSASRSVESRSARRRVASREREVGEDAKLISSL